MLRQDQRADAPAGIQPAGTQRTRLSRGNLGHVQRIDEGAALEFRLSGTADLKTRDDDDFTIAFLDATAIVLDILSFYQERRANESYLRTATQLRSLTELSRLIGYQPGPGVAAATYVAFTLRQAPGQPPDPTAAPLPIPRGTQVQSVPAQGQTPQTFETSADIQAKPDWNARCRYRPARHGRQRPAISCFIWPAPRPNYSRAICSWSWATSAPKIRSRAKTGTFGYSRQLRPTVKTIGP